MENCRITNIEIILVKHPLRNKKFPYAYYVISGFIFFKVYTNEGLVGYGEPNPYIGNFKIVSNLFKKNFLPLILGQNIHSISLKKIKQKLGSKLDIRTVNCILAGLDQAIWDIRGKILNKPLFAMFIKKPKRDNSIDLYASGGMIYEDQSYNHVVNEALEYKELGFKGYKFRPSISRKSLSHFERTKKPPSFDTEKLLEACLKLRQSLGNNFRLMLDTGCRINSVSDYLLISDCLKELNFFFLEEPFKREIRLYKKTKQFKKVQIAAGEALQTKKDFVNWSKNIDILQPDSNMITIDEILKLKKHLKNNKKKIIFHNWANPISMYSNFHLSKILNGNFIEYNITYNPVIKNLLKNPINVKKGKFFFNKEEGLGIEINNDFIKKYSVKI